MFDIGVIGGDEVADTLNELYAMTEEPRVRITRIDKDTAPQRFNVLVINNTGAAEKFLSELTHGDVILLNADNKSLYGYLAGGRGRLVTYGFSGKSCVTASSVVDGAYERVQICIQRSLPTLTGGELEPQEFSISFASEKNIHMLLAAAAAALIAGFAVENFSE